MATEDIIQRGIEAAKSGDHTTAKTLLSKAVLQYPDSEEAWWWLGLILEDPEQRAYCFNKVVELNPENVEAQAQLMRAERVPTAEPSDPTPAHTPPFVETEPEAEVEDEDLWGKPELETSRRRSSQQAILAVLILAVLCVAIGGGAYIFLDTTGFLTLAAPPPPSATAVQQPESTEDAATPEMPPTWTPTLTLSPSPTAPIQTDTPEVTPSPTEVLNVPTPEDYPDPDVAEPILLVEGTGPISLDPNEQRVFEFQPSLSFQIQSIALLAFNLLGDEAAGSPQLLLLLWNPSEGEWSTINTRWGTTTIIPPGDYMSADGRVIAALWNWGLDPISIQNAGFNYTVWTQEGRRLTISIGEEGYVTVPDTATPVNTPPNFDS